MKNILFVLLVVLSAGFSIAQESSSKSKHLLFKGVPIDGTLSEFVTKMKQSGLTHVGTQDGIAMLTGEFASYKGCFVGVSTLKQKDLVNRVIVAFPEQEKWSSLSDNYFLLKELLTEKYGAPSSELEKFETSYLPDGDDYKMYEVQSGGCKYFSIFELETGKIELSISHDEETRCFVMLEYYDTINSEIIKAKIKGDL